MKVAATRDSSAFKPVTLTLTLESQPEVDAIFAIFNHQAILDGTRRVLDEEAVRAALTEHRSGPLDTTWRALNETIKEYH
jgi:hypothetical protein